MDKLKFFLKKHFRLLLIISCLLLIAINYVLIMQIKHNHLSYTHLMYIPVVLAGGLLGIYEGVTIGLLAGLVVGPLMPRFLDTGEPQYLWDWIFRMTMMIIIGFISGWIAGNYKKVKQKIDQALYTHPESGLYNINYLRHITLEKQKSYTFISFDIFNAEMIRNVMGHEAYYSYLFQFKKRIENIFKDSIVIQPNNHKLWIIFPEYHFEKEIQTFNQLAYEASQMKDQKIFVDYAIGYSKERHVNEKVVSNYFIHTDLAAKEAKKSYITYKVYADLRTKQTFEYEILADFHDALYQGDIYLVYQPKINLKTKKPTGLEALIRWEHPTKKMINPDEFIPAVENTNMIHEMTEKVFEWALNYQSSLKRKGIDIPVSINISTKNLYNPEFFSRMTQIFSAYDILPQKVELEITETVLMENPELSKMMLEKFANFGFKIAIDDFGKGYSSLAYLAQFPINTIKIDKFFSRQILINPTTQTIVKATIDLAKQLGYEVLIEGIEDLETAELLERLGCHSAQGYLFMRPRREEDITEYLKKY